MASKHSDAITYLYIFEDGRCGLGGPPGPGDLGSIGVGIVTVLKVFGAVNEIDEYKVEHEPKACSFEDGYHYLCD